MGRGSSELRELAARVAALERLVAELTSGGVLVGPKQADIEAEAQRVLAEARGKAALKEAAEIAESAGLQAPAARRRARPKAASEGAAGTAAGGA